MSLSERDAIRAELRWVWVVAAAVLVILGAVIYAGLVLSVNPPSNYETLDPKTLHLSGEFTEGNLGTRVRVRMVTAQFRFAPSCVVVPAGREVTLRFASPDVIHGILVTGTNVNTMVIPGFVSQVHTVLNRTGDLLMPCHEYCGIGHSQMWATVRVVPPDEFQPDADGRVSCG
jgi:cytochrome c oxidase subunit 2